MYSITQDLLTLGSKNRPGTQITPTAIVSHRTGNPGSTAKNNRDYCNRGEVYAGAHYFVDENTIIQAVPDNEKTYHVAAGYKPDGTYVHPNDYAIGIEFCEPYTEAKYLKYVWLHAYLASKYNIIDIKPHSWYDPVDRPNDTGDLFSWTKFINDVNYERAGGGALFSDINGHWAKDSIEYVANLGLLKGYEDGTFKPDVKMSRAEVATVLAALWKLMQSTKIST